MSRRSKNKRAAKKAAAATVTAAAVAIAMPITVGKQIPQDLVRDTGGATAAAVDMVDPLHIEEEQQRVRTLEPQLVREDEEPSGVDGVVIFDGRMREDELSRSLVGRQRYITFTNILINTAIVASGFRFYSNLMRRAAWGLEPANDTPEAATRSDFVREVMDGMDDQSWSSVIASISKHKYYGFSIHEMVTKKMKGGRIGFAGIFDRPQFTIERWDKRGDKLIGVGQKSEQTKRELYLERSRIIHCVDNAVSSAPWGLGLARHLVEVTDKLRGYEELEARGFETDLRGTPIGYAPLSQLTKGCKNDAEKEEQKTKGTAALQNFIRNYRKGNDSSLVLDSDVQRGGGDQQTPITIGKWRIELLRGDPTTLEELAQAIERKNREAARILGVEMLLLGATSAGSLALSQDKNLAFGLNVDAGLGEVADSLQKDFLGYLWDQNGWDRADGLMPKMKPEKQQFRSVQEIADALQALALSGAPLLPNDPAINELRDLMGISHMPAELIAEAINVRMATLSEDSLGRDASVALTSPQGGEDNADEGEN